MNAPTAKEIKFNKIALQSDRIAKRMEELKAEDKSFRAGIALNKFVASIEVAGRKNSMFAVPVNAEDRTEIKRLQNAYIDARSAYLNF